MTEYVCGFLFNEAKDEVVLIRKNKPIWQAGLLNGVGGKVEELESPMEAMIREFREETALNFTEWQPFATIKCEKAEWVCYFFFGANDCYDIVRTATDEEIIIKALSDLKSTEVIPNLNWLIPMAKDAKHIYCSASAEE